MAKKKRKKRNVIPPREDPKKTELVKKGSGWYLRSPRGSINEAVLNDSLEKNKEAWEITNPATKRITAMLEPFTRCFSGDYLHQRLNGQFTRPYNEKGVIEFSGLTGFEIHRGYPLDALLLSQYSVQQHEHSIEISVPVEKGCVKRNNKLVTDFYFEGILLYGDALAGGLLNLEYAVSAPYSFTDIAKNSCTLVLPLPQQGEPWMLLLKVSCLEGYEMAVHQKHYGMKVIAAG